MTYNLNQKSSIHTLKEQLKNNKNKSLRNIIIELHLSGQYPYVKGIYELLSNQTNLAVYFSLLDDEFYNIKNHLSRFGVTDDKLIFASTVPSLEWIDLFISPTNWTTFIPKGNMPKIQLFHSLIYKNTIFAGQFNDFNHIFFPGQHHKDYYYNEYIKNFPHLAKTQKTFDIGYPKLDEVINDKINKLKVLPRLGLKTDRPTVVYAPTWELTASLHTKGLQIIDILANMDLNVLVKLHPMSYRDPKFTFANGGIDWKAVIASIEKKYKNVKNILDPDANPYIVASDLMITDASGVGLEFMTTNKPIVFIDVPEFFENCGYGGVEDKCRVVGDVVKDISNLKSIIKENLNNPKKYKKQRKEFISKLLFNPGQAAEKAAEKILELLDSFSNKKTASVVDSVDIESARREAAKVDGFLTDREGELLYALAKNCTGKGVIVEIGSWKGKSTIWLGKGSKAGNNIKVYAIDPHSGTPAHKRQGVPGTFEIFKQNIKNAGVGDMVMPIVKPAEQIAKDFDEPIEIIFIDGDHEYESVKQDFELWLPKMVEGGMILLHDSAGPNAWPGVRKFVNELVNESKDVINAMVADSITYVEVEKSFSIKENKAINAVRPDIQKELTSIIVIALNGLDYTKRCIESIRKYTNLPYELIVVDNGSTDGTLEYLKQQKDIKLIANTENVGAPFARNQGLKVAKGEYIMFFDNDIVATKNWLDILVDHAKNNPDIGLIGPVSNYVSGAQFVPNSDFKDLNEMQFFAEELLLSKRGRLTYFPRLILFAMFARHELVEKIGGFDPLYGKWGFEDDDYCLRALIAGFKLVIAEDVFIYHKGSSTSQSANIDYNKLLEENWENFKKKWGLPKYLSYMQGYPIDTLANQPFDREKHYCSLTDRRPSTEISATEFHDLSPIFTKSTVDGLTDNHKEQFVLFNILDECEGNVLEAGYKDVELSAMIAASGVNVTRLTTNLEEDTKKAKNFYLNNLEIKEGSFADLSKTNRPYDVVVLYSDENVDTKTVGEVLESAKNIVKTTGRIIFACKTNYRTRSEIKDILDMFGGGKYHETVPSPYILISFTNTKIREESDDLIITQFKKPLSLGMVSVILVINDSASNWDKNDLSNCIKRVYSQSYNDIELVVCNLSGDKNIKNALKSYGGNYKYIESSKRINEAVELAVSHAEGDYIALVTPNDLLLPKAIEIRVSALQDNYFDAVCTDSVNFLERLDGVRLRHSARVSHGGKAVQEQLMGNRVQTAASLLRKSAFTKVSLTDSNFEKDFNYGFWLNLFADGINVKNVNIPTILHKLTKYEESILQADIRVLDDFSQLDQPDRIGILKRFIKVYPVTILSPSKVGIGENSQLKSALFAYRASVLIQNNLYGEALHDLAQALRRIPTDIGVRNDIKDLITFLLMKTIELSDNLLIKSAAKLLIKLDGNSPLANLHLIRLQIEQCFGKNKLSLSKINNILSQLVKYHSENKFDPYQYLCYGYIACLFGSQEIMNKMFGKALSMNLAIPVVGTAMKMVEQHSLGQKFEDNNDVRSSIENLKNLIRESSVSLIMIVKNEEENLERCLRSAEGVVDEIVIVDTGSSDRTKEIAQSFGAKIVDNKWKGDFSEARNVSIDNATGDWVMFLDADEELVEEDKELLIDLKNDTLNEGFNFVINSFVGDINEQNIVSNIATRMWKNRSNHRFSGALHEQILGAVASTGPVKTINVRINHYGYLNKLVEDKDKIERNLELALKAVNDEPENSFAYYNLGIEYVRTADHRKAFECFEKSARYLSDKDAYYAHFLSLNRVRALRLLNKSKEALNLFEEDELKYPDFPDLIYEKALAQINLKRFTDAVATLRNLTTLKPDPTKYVTQLGVTTYWSYYTLGSIYEMIGDRKSAVIWYSKAFKTYSKFLHNTAALVKILLKTDKEEKVKDYIDKYIDTNDSFLLSDLGTIFLNEGKPKVALDYLNKALSIDDKTPNLVFLLGKANLYIKNRDIAASFLNKVISSSKNYTESRIELAYCYGLDNNLKKLREILKEISAEKQLKPYITVISSLFEAPGFGNESKFDDTTTKKYWQMLQKIMVMGEFDWFEKALSISNRLNMEQGLIALNLGKLYEEGGFKDLATQQYLNALNNGYYDSESLVALGDECNKQELREDAVNFYLSATHTDPPLVGSYIKLVKLLMEQKNYKKAEDVLEECNRKFPESDLIKQTLKTMKSIFLKTP